MDTLRNRAVRFVSSTAFAAALLMTGCTVHAAYYDPYYHDRHVWSGEVTYYNQWEHDTHREHRDFGRRRDEEKKEYWEWRHSHEH
ncbi:MAG TPA: hypothetical protein VH308_05180 [Terracidiphilus sp.]|jgi:hypothetical protein|nr:hypothetical protein [Terracidiphilus sp.]